MIRARLSKITQMHTHIRPKSTVNTRKGPLVLPRLPVPDLRKTLDKYLTSLEPILLEDEVRGGTSYQSAYALRVKWADEFESNVGRLCQERLLGPLSSWLFSSPC